MIFILISDHLILTFIYIQSETTFIMFITMTISDSSLISNEYFVILMCTLLYNIYLQNTLFMQTEGLFFFFFYKF